jgi:putative nucleotidyltransferase with HDIG domain
MTWATASQLERTISQNDELLDELKWSNDEIQTAYQTTLEGWSRALEIRDRETEGHTKRVTDLTLRLARHMGISGENLIHVHRGALLHDIGKLGIPDEILRKPGPLTEKEKRIMQLHPQIALELLKTIEYLRHSLNIPRYHHEKWDGTGYPYGLIGESIPLEARIFAVVDVFDALTHDRVYRKAMSVAEAVEYIKAEAGKHFDPIVVEAFLKEIGALED